MVLPVQPFLQVIVNGAREEDGTDYAGVRAQASLRFWRRTSRRVCIDILSSVSYSFRTFDIDAPPIAAMWLGGEGGQDASMQPVDASLRYGGAESDLPQGDA